MDLDWIAPAVGASRVRRGALIQTLWGGYGELFRVELTGAAVETAIVKWARPPRGVRADASFERKCRSYDVETAFYRTVAPRCDGECRVARLLAARSSADEREWFLVLEDLDRAGYDQRVEEASGQLLDAALAWLATFHARFLGEHIDGVWPVGTYWHLGTRRAEHAAIEDQALRDAAPHIAARLAAARYQTLLHGDPKEANFCFTRDGAAAAVDFQYTGHGCAMSDVAYLLYGRADEPAEGIDHARLDIYFRHLRRALARRPDAVDADAAEAEWRELYPVARLDFARFMAGWRRV